VCLLLLFCVVEKFSAHSGRFLGVSRSLVDPVEPVVESVSSEVGLGDVFGLLLELLDRHVVLEATVAELLERLDRNG
jgi:hypothetical protein